MNALTAERQSPFRPIENPFRRVLPAVDKMKSNVMQTIRNTGDALAQRMQRSHVEDSAHLRQARATIATETHRPSIKKAIIHNVVEATKNSAPAAIVGAGARIALGAGLGLQTMAVAAGASAVSRGVREATFTIRKGAYSETTKLITKHEEASTLANFDRTTRQAHTGIRARQDQFAQTRVGRVVNAVLHGGEKKIAQFAYGKHRHAKALMQARTQDIHTLSDKELIALREHAVMARMTHGTADKVYEMRQLAKSTYQSVNRELAARGFSRHEAHERQLQLYKKDVRVGAAINVIGQAGLAALKAVPKTVATFFITDAFLKVIGVDTSARHNPLDGFENTQLGQFIENAIAPKSVAHAEGITADIPHTVSTPAVVDQTSEAQRFGNGWASGKDVVDHTVNIDPRLTTTVREIHGHTYVESHGVLPSEAPKATTPAPVRIPTPPGHTPPTDNTDVAQLRGAAILEPIAQEDFVRAPQVETLLQQQTIARPTSLTQDIFDKKLLPGMGDVTTAREWYGQTGTAAQMMQYIIEPNKDKLTPTQFAQLQTYLAANPDASFGAMWRENGAVFTDMNRWTEGDVYTIATEHSITPQQIAMEVKEEQMAAADEPWSKSPGHAKYLSINNQQTDGPGVVLTPTQSTGADTTHYQIVRPPQGASAPGVINTSQGTYQQVAAPGEKSVPGNTVNGFQQVRKPGEVISNNGTTNTQVVTSPQNGIVPAPHQTGSPDTGMSVSNAIHGYQQVAPPGVRNTISNSSGAFQEVGQPTAPRPVVVARPANESFQIVSPPKPQEQVSFQEVSLPRATVQYETSSDIRTASVMGRFDLGSGNSHVAYLESTSPYFPSSSSMPISMLNDRAPAIGAGAYEYNALGGTNIWTHTSSFKEGGKQWLEDPRVYMQGGNGQPRLGPVQQLRRAQELMQSAPHLFINIDNQHQGGFSLTGVHHLLLNNDGSLNLASTDGIIGGGPDTLSFIGCSYGHVQAIQMIIDHSAEAPPHLNQWFGILNDPYATGENVENAVDQIVKQWFRSTEYYNDFYKLYGYLLEEIPTPGTSEYSKFLNNLADNGYMSSGRLEFEFSIGGQ